jgi:hypothetical protein
MQKAPAERNQVIVLPGDPPLNPRFLASLGTLSLVELDLCLVVDLGDFP